MPGFNRKLDDLGRISIPKEFRKTLHWYPGAEIEMNPQEDGSIILKKYEPNFSKRVENLRQELKEYQIEETNSFDTNLDSLLEEVLKQLNKMEA